MIATAMIDGVAIEIRGSAVECFEFFRLMNPKPKKVCDPFARHYGNCGAEDCPILCHGVGQ